MRFLVDRCAGARLAEWLRSSGHDVVEARELGPDPGDRALLELAEPGDCRLPGTEEGRAAHLNVAPEDGDLSLIMAALGDIAHARSVMLSAAN